MAKAAHEYLVDKMRSFIESDATADELRGIDADLENIVFPKGHTTLIETYRELCGEFDWSADDAVIQKLEQEMAEAAAKELDDDSAEEKCVGFFTIPITFTLNVAGFPGDIPRDEQEGLLRDDAERVIGALRELLDRPLGMARTFLLGSSENIKITPAEDVIEARSADDS